MPDAVGPAPYYSRTLHERGKAWVLQSEADHEIGRLQRELVSRTATITNLKTELRSAGRLAASDALVHEHRERSADRP